MKGITSSFLQDSRDGKKKLLEWFLNNVMEEESNEDRCNSIGSVPFEACCDNNYGYK